MPSKILLIAPPVTSDSVAHALRSKLNVEVEIALRRRAGLACLKKQQYLLVMVDEAIAAEDAHSTDQLYRDAGSAPVLEVNFTLSSAERIVRQVRSALARRSYDLAQGRAAGAIQLQHELNASLSGLLLESELALREALPEQEPKLRHIVALAGEMRDLLRT